MESSRVGIGRGQDPREDYERAVGENLWKNRRKESWDRRRKKLPKKEMLLLPLFKKNKAS